MMRQMLFGVGVFLVSSSMVWAGDSTDIGQGMGTVQPNAHDLSLSPNWHVYTFKKQGIHYLQVNDNAGQVHLGLGVANGVYLVLPMGSDAGNVSTPDAPLTTTLSNVEVVYRDSETVLSVGTNSLGQLVWSAVPASTSTTAVTAEECDANSCPINRIQSALPTTQTSSATQSTSLACDPNSCPINRGP
jgi:hypothetical protein